MPENQPKYTLEKYAELLDFCRKYNIPDYSETIEMLMMLGAFSNVKKDQ